MIKLRKIGVLIYSSILINIGGRSGGGEFELHSDPRSPEQNQIKTFLPIFNRAILMETNEFSWHGFLRIKLPD